MSLRFRRFVCAVGVIPLVFALCPARADDAESVKKKLDEAKKAYEDEAAKFKKGITDLLNKREEDARKAGNKKLVDQIKAEQIAFEKTGEVPAVIPMALRQQITTARGKLDKAYSATVKDYVRFKEDAAAEATEKEQKKFTIETAFLFGRRMPLTILKPFDVKTEKDGFAHDVSLPVLKGTVPHGIRLYPVSEGVSQISYNLGGKCSALRVRVGVPKFEDTVKPPASELTFEVLGDGKSLWKSNPTNKLDELQVCEVSLDKIKVLTLRVHCPKSSEWARACWFEPILAE